MPTVRPQSGRFSLPDLHLSASIRSPEIKHSTLAGVRSMNILILYTMCGLGLA